MSITLYENDIGRVTFESNPLEVTSIEKCQEGSYGISAKIKYVDSEGKTQEGVMFLPRIKPNKKETDVSNKWFEGQIKDHFKLGNSNTVIEVK